MATPKLIRTLKRGDSGPDVLAVKRALKAAGYGRRLVLNRTAGAGFDYELRAFQRDHYTPADGIYGSVTHQLLWPHFDAYGKKLLSEAPKPDPRMEKFNQLLAYMHLMTVETPGYLWGGGHGTPLSEVRPDQKLDCSSSTSLALHHVGLFPHDEAWVSGQFAASYGDPGDGELFTIMANGDHVWVRLKKGPYWRFDTSPYNDGGFGPRLRKLPRPTWGFTRRHAKGY